MFQAIKALPRPKTAPLNIQISGADLETSPELQVRVELEKMTLIIEYEQIKTDENKETVLFKSDLILISFRLCLKKY